MLIMLSATLFDFSEYAPVPEVFFKCSAAIIPQGVLIPPGSITTTSIPNGLVSTRKLSDQPSRACLEAVYHAPNGL